MDMRGCRLPLPALAVAVAAVAAAPAGGGGCGETDIVGDVDADGDWADEADPDAWDTDTDTADSGVDVPDSPDETECLPCTSSPDPWVRVAATRPARSEVDSGPVVSTQWMPSSRQPSGSVPAVTV